MLPPSYSDYLASIFGSEGASSSGESRGEGNAGLPEGKFSSGTSTFTADGVSVVYPSSFEASEDVFGGVALGRDFDWIFARLDNSSDSLDKIEDDLGYRLSEDNAQIYRSTYNGKDCVVLMYDDVFGPGLEIHVPLGDKKLFIKFESMTIKTLDELLGDDDVMAIMTSVSW